jgi:hypothetical protein
MISAKDQDFIDRLIEATVPGGRIKWEPTATQNQYVSTFKGKWILYVDEYEVKEGRGNYYTLKMTDLNDREMLNFTNGDYSGVKGLYESARRAALRVDEAISDIMGEI